MGVVHRKYPRGECSANIQDVVIYYPEIPAGHWRQTTIHRICRTHSSGGTPSSCCCARKFRSAGLWELGQNIQRQAFNDWTLAATNLSVVRYCLVHPYSRSIQPRLNTFLSTDSFTLCRNLAKYPALSPTTKEHRRYSLRIEIHPEGYGRVAVASQT